MLRESIWRNAASDQIFPSLNSDLVVDVAIIGAGITGVSTALGLRNTGKKVALFDSGLLGAANTADSTGNLYATIDSYLFRLKEKWGDEVVNDVVRSREYALSITAGAIDEYELRCDFQRCPWMLFCRENDTSTTATLARELDVARKMALDARLDKQTTGGKNIAGLALVIENQAQFHPMKYVRHLAKALAGNDCLIFEKSSINAIDPQKREIQCNGFKVVAEHIVMATHTPKGFNPLQAEMHANREYGIAAHVNDEVVPGIFWDISQGEKYSVRYAHLDEGTEGSYLIVVGGKHSVGDMKGAAAAFDKLKIYLHTNHETGGIAFQWSGQHYVPADGLPYIGISPFSEYVHVATGYSTDGLVYGTLAGSIISAQILGTSNKWASLYAAKRFTPLKSSKNVLATNSDVMTALVQDYLLHSHLESLSNVGRGDGALVKIKGKTLAVYRDETDQLVALSPVCPHMKCQVHWNGAEKTWDCPCHGSRFDLRGDVIEGPALTGLEMLNLASDHEQ